MCCGPIFGIIFNMDKKSTSVGKYVALARALMWLTELAISVAAPLVLFVYGAIWLRNRYGLGVWVVLAGAALGLYSTFMALKASFTAMGLLNKPKPDSDKPNFNSHD